MTEASEPAVMAGTKAPNDDAALERRRWLARHATSVVRLLHAAPDGWTDPRFSRQVEATRVGLLPIRTRRALVASFSREGALLGRRLGASPLLEGPVPVAYAIRWHELGGRSDTRDVPAT
ncbi:MAG TPA: hypothetical protein VEY67_05815 [Candidatus Dormibacteraeota bacterium]|nr:hypothetical protein [Candidatus Dormibacteraeota bacterium]